MSFKKNLKLQLKHLGEGFLARHLARNLLVRLLWALVALPVFILGWVFGLSSFGTSILSGVLAASVVALAMRWRVETSTEETDIAHYGYVCEACKSPTPEADCVCVVCGFNSEDSDAGVHLKRKE